MRQFLLVLSVLFAGCATNAYQPSSILVIPELPAVLECRERGLVDLTSGFTGEWHCDCEHTVHESTSPEEAKLALQRLTAERGANVAMIIYSSYSEFTVTHQEFCCDASAIRQIALTFRCGADEVERAKQLAALPRQTPN